MMRLAKFVTATLLSGLLAGCTVGPNYHRPPSRPRTAYRDLSHNPQLQAQAASYADLPWWQVFQDPKLQELIRNGAQAELRFAAGHGTHQRCARPARDHPLQPVSASCEATAISAVAKNDSSQSRFNFLTLAADAAFQLDFFGRLRRANEAARAQLLATEDARQTVILTLVSDVASDYFTLLQLDLQLQITHETVKTQTDSVKLTTTAA